MPADAGQLRARLLQSVRADPKSARPVAALTGQEAYVALRTAYRRGLVDLAVKDLCAADPLDFMPAAGAELADLAGAAIEAALAVSRAEAAEQFERRARWPTSGWPSSAWANAAPGSSTTSPTSTSST